MIRQPLARSELSALSFLPSLRFTPRIVIGTPQVRRGNTRLSLRLERVRVEEGQDAYWLWGRRNTTDEVSVGITAIDETGDVSSGHYNLGSIHEGREKNYGNKVLACFDLTEGGDIFPRLYSVTVHAIELDDGGWNKFLDKVRDYARKKVNGELLAAGITWVGTALGVPIPPEVASLIANAVKKFIDNVIDWVLGLFKNNDDVLGSKARRARIHSYNGNWVSSGTQQSASWDWVFSGEGGRWRTTMHWLLQKSTAGELPTP